MENEGRCPRRPAIADLSIVRGANDEQAPFTGRQSEMQLLHAALERAGEGAGHLVLLSGARGMGKTRTAAELTKRAKQRGFGVIWGRCPKAGTENRCAAWEEIFDQCWYGLHGQSQSDRSCGPEGLDETITPIAVTAGAGSSSSEGGALQFSGAFDEGVGLLGEVARRAPQVAVLDDLQDADPDSLLFLRFLAHHLDGLPLLMVATYCEEGLPAGHPLFDTLLEVGRVPATMHLELGGLDGTDLGRLVAQVADVEYTARDISTLRQCTNGNPLFILELLKGFGLERLRELSENGLRIVPVPSAVRAVVAGRVDSLSDACRRGLQIAATIGCVFPAALVSALVVEKPDDGEGRVAAPRPGAIESVDAVLGEAVHAKVVYPLADAPGCYRFSDWFVMNVLRQELPVETQAAAHRRIALVLDREHSAVPCLTEWAFAGGLTRGRAGAGTGNGAAVCTRRCQNASFLENLSRLLENSESADGGGAPGDPPGDVSIPLLVGNPEGLLFESSSILSARDAVAVLADDPGGAVADGSPRSASLRKEGDYWTIRFGGVTTQLKESKGLVYLQNLLRHPGRSFFALDLVALANGNQDAGSAIGAQELSSVGYAFSSRAEPMMDAQARAAYRDRLAELREELAEAESVNDLGQVERIRDEIEQLLSLWQDWTGLGGRTRSVVASVTERARSAVTKRIRAEIVRIATVQTELGRHLAMTIVTGQVCSYEPDRDAPVVWDL